jgi:hypothetical protein
MSKKMIFLISSVLAATLAGNVSAVDRYYTDASGVNHLWSRAGNWNTGVPTSSDGAMFQTKNSRAIVDANNTTAAASYIRMGSADLTNITPLYLDINGGTLTVGTYLGVGYYNEDESYGAWLTVNSGTVNVGTDLRVSYYGYGTVTINSGTINVTGTLKIAEISSSKYGHVQINGGIINANDLTMRTGGGIGTMDIRKGKLKLTGDKVSKVQGYINNGWITGYGIEYAVSVKLVGGNTEVTASGGGGIASGPSPANNTKDVSPDITLTWIPAAAAESHDVYIGTSFANVNDANHTTPPRVYKGNYDVNSYHCGSYQTEQTYYWRIDEVNEPNTWKGEVWSFTTGQELDYPLGDLGGDGVVGWDDLAMFVDLWLDTSCPCADIDGDNNVNMTDYSIFADNWLLNSDVWVNIDPGGGGAFFAAGGGPAGLIVVGADLSGGYMSSDDGKHWDVLGFTRGVDGTHVCGVGFDSKDPSIFYLGAEDYMFRTANGGASFNAVSSGGYYTDIVFSPADANIGYVSRMPSWNDANSQIYKTTSRGLSWSKSSADLPTKLWIRKIVTHPTNANIVYASSSNKYSGTIATYKSTNGGVNWTKVAPSLTNVWDLALDPVNPQNVYVVAANGVNKSTDGGSNWSLRTSTRGHIFVNFKNPQILRLINASGVWESLNGSSNWTQKSSLSDWDPGFTPTFAYGYREDYKTVNADMSDPNRYYWISYQWVYGSFDGGAKFKPLYTRQKPAGSGWWRTTRINNTEVYDIAISEANPDHIYLGFYDMGLWRSTNHGESWRTGNSVSLTGEWNGKGGNTKTVVADPDRVGVVWACMADTTTYGIITKSTADGTPASWVGTSPMGDVWGLSLDRNSPVYRRKLFATIDANVYRSTNDGNSWSQVFSGGSTRATAVDNFDSDLVFAGGVGGLWRSTSGGGVGTWTTIGLAEMTDIYDIKTDPVHSGWVYVTCYGDGTSKGLYRSKNQGLNWEKLLADPYMRGVAIDPVDPNIIYATSSKNDCCGGSPYGSNGVQRSINGGQTWVKVNEGLPWPFAWPIEVDPSNHNRVFVGSPGTGFYKRMFSN